MTTRGGAPVAVEVAVQDARGARVAREAGADRVELCVGLVTGGLTPTPAAVAQVVAVGLPVHVLVRPRPGGFVHDDDEVTLLVAQVREALGAGATGVVVGALTPDREVDVPTLGRLVAAADGAPVTFHRAFDVVAAAGPGAAARALDRLAAAGVRRVLTSGGAERAGDAADGLAALVRHAAGRVEVMAGGGVVPATVPALVRAGVDAVHLSGRGPAEDRGPTGPGGGAPSGRDTIDADVVRAAVAAARGRGEATG